MIAHFHFLRPWFLLAFLPLCFIFWKIGRQKGALGSWDRICDPHLLPYLMQKTRSRARRLALIGMFVAGSLLSIALAGPTWKRLPVPTYQATLPRVVLLDMSDAMLEKDLKPDRLTRAKFKLHDLFKRKIPGQFGFIVFTDEPFVVSPLTEDANTIDALVDMLSQDVMPVGGQRLDRALEEASKLIAKAGFAKGQILVLSASPPSSKDILAAETLAAKGLQTSVMPVLADPALLPLFKPLANAGQGRVFTFKDKEKDWDAWLKKTEASADYIQNQNELPRWRDEGPWFILPALLLLMPVFRRLWLQRI